MVFFSDGGSLNKSDFKGKSLMLIVVSPAKTLDYTSPLATTTFTLPELTQHSAELIDVCRELTPMDIASLMKVSDKIAGLNAARFAEWQPEFTVNNARQAILAFKGDVYTGLAAETMTDAEFAYTQQHLRMLSGLYGVLRPLDLMQPYRLEMGTRLTNPRGSNLYQFWGISSPINSMWLLLNKVMILWLIWLLMSILKRSNLSNFKRN